MKKIGLTILPLIVIPLFANCSKSEMCTVAFMTNTERSDFFVKVKKGSKVKKPDNPQADSHYCFDSWYLDNETFKNEFDFNTPIVSDLTLYANYTQIDFKVSFYTFTTDEPFVVYTENNKVKEPTNPEHFGWTFQGWYYTGLGIFEKFDFNTEIKHDINLYASWSNYFIIVFDSLGGSSVEPAIIKYGETASKPDDPTKKGNKFMGWYQSPDFAKTSEFDFSTSIVNNYILYAKFLEAATVTFNNGGSPQKIPSQLVLKGECATCPEVEEWTKHKFKGWYYNKSLFDFNTKIYEDITLRAKWNELFTITFNANGGSSVPSKIVEFGECLDKPVDPTHEKNLIFAGWYYDDKTFKEKYDFNVPVINEFTLYAKWIVEVTLNADDGGVIEKNHEQTLKCYLTLNSKWSEAIESTYGVIKDGKEFLYWKKDETKITDDFTITEPITLKPVFGDLSDYFTILPRCSNANIVIDPCGCDFSYKIEDSSSINDEWTVINEKKSIALSSGSRLLLKGNNPSGVISDGFYNSNYFHETQSPFAISGLVDSILTNSTASFTAEPPQNILDGLLSDCKVVSAYNCSFLPEVSNYSYNACAYMFKNCHLLIAAPKKIITKENAEGSLQAMACMFEYCESLVYPFESFPTKFNSTSDDFRYMFEGCTSLKKAPKLPSDSTGGLGEYVYGNMFYNCASLLEAPSLPAKSLNRGCYWRMFEGCKSLVKAPELPATSLIHGCYWEMFEDCTSLTIPPIIPDFELLPSTCDWCLSSMFKGCSSLEVTESKTNDSSKKLFFTCPKLGYDTIVSDMFTNTKGHEELKEFSPKPGYKYYYTEQQ